ncbi:PLP-dependent cysteine synthase family protein [Nocardia sp. NPDC057353]|uniref:PLP-dependent cysteine synthase family protein n=1 Tax=Nocardia sp. NPDC057353 TaxID=3346104 RepID=UPI00363416E9
MTAVAGRGAGVYESVDAAIGGTPLVRLNRVTEGCTAGVYVKLEYLNPGGSVKDRAALGMIDAAEASGALRPGGTVVEATSGNTGIGLVAIAAARGYPTIVVVPDKTSREKVALLRAYGAEVHVTAGGRPVGHPEHVRSIALKLAEQTPGAWFAGQYDNPANPEAHRATTGPEIWAQTGGRVTHYVAGVGTGGTITGAGEYLREISAGRVTVIGADPATSVYGGGDGRAWYVESVGHFLHPDTEEDLWPESYHPEVVARIESVGDVEAISLLHRLAREEGLLLGGSSGTAVAAALRVARDLGPEDVVVVIAPDSGRAYLSKYYDDDWLGRFGFPLVRPLAEPSVADRADVSGAAPVIGAKATVGEARALLGAHPVLPVVLHRTTPGDPVAAEVQGSLRAVALAGLDDAEPVAAHLEAPLPLLGSTEPAAAALERAGDGPVLLVHEGRAVALLGTAELARLREL